MPDNKLVKCANPETVKLPVFSTLCTAFGLAAAGSYAALGGNQDILSLCVLVPTIVGQMLLTPASGIFGLVRTHNDPQQPRRHTLLSKGFSLAGGLTGIGFIPVAAIAGLSTAWGGESCTPQSCGPTIFMLSYPGVCLALSGALNMLSHYTREPRPLSPEPTNRKKPPSI